MFNEILTGRASLEPTRPVPPTPTARLLAAANQTQRGNDGTWNTLRWILAIAVILGLAFFRYGMRKQMAEDDAVMHGHRPSY